ncbi:MAG: glycosyl hydrolase-related protein [Lachnospiraceae bacterium]|nr:glycosyl hydrolase-related protein [Lachnospiraceae bacterium]
MWFLDKRAKVICDELRRLSVVKKIPLEDILYKEGLYFRPEEADAAEVVSAAGRTDEWQRFDPKTMKWYGPDKHYWFRTDYTVPEELAGKALRLNVRTQIREWDDGKNPQFLLFVNGEVTQGLDMNHRTVQMTASAAAGETWRIDLQAYTGTLHSEFDMLIDVQQVDLLIEKLFYDISVPLQALPRMDKDDQNRLKIEEILNNAVNLIDLRTPYSEAFYQSVQEASDYLDQALYTDMAGWDDVVATCIGHTHIDVAWWWTVAQTREKVARSFATVLKLMDEYPNYKFMSSQPQLYQFLKERYPEIYARIKERVKEGRWEPEGGMWLEADTNLTSGESLVRQFVYGKRFFREEFGTDCRILWLPDVFGYSGALPQIMKKSGIDYFMTTKLAWNQVDKMPYDTFRWRGIDGSEVLTHLITTLGVGQDPEENFFTTYNGLLHPDAIMGGWKRYQNKDINNDILISYGFGDGGGGPTREMLETSIRMEKGVRGIPKVRQETSRVYFDELNERVKDSRRLPTWEGELYFEYHRGTYTSMARNKRGNRKSELLMMNLELLSVLARLAGQGVKEADPVLCRGMAEGCLDDITDVAAEKKRMDAFWTKILLNQFHDILPGSSIHEVYEVTKKEYQWIAEEAGEMLEHRLDAVAGKGDALTLFNTLSFERGDIVRLPLAGARKSGADAAQTAQAAANAAQGCEAGMNTAQGCETADNAAAVDLAQALRDDSGAIYPIQAVAGERLAYVDHLPLKGWRSYEIVDLPAAADGEKAPETGDFVLSGDGETGGCPLEKTAQLNAPFCLRENCLETPYYVIRLDDSGCFSSIFDKENDREVLQEGKQGNLFRMYEDKPIYYDNWDIDIFYTEKSWDVDQLTRLEWISIGPVCAVLEIERPISNSLIRQRIYFYAQSRRIDFETWVDWKEHQHLLKVQFPVAVHTDEASFDIQFGNLTRKVHTNTSWDMARFESCGQKWMDLSEGHYGVSLLNDCKYGHSVKDSVMALTLIKSGIEPNPVADQEEHIFTYSLYPHAGNLRECETVRESYCLNLPVLAKADASPGASGSLLTIDQKNVIVETVKPAEDGNGIILRIYEYENARTKASVRFGLGKKLAGVQECSLLEEPVGEPAAHTDDGFEFTIQPFEIKTFRVVLE